MPISHKNTSKLPILVQRVEKKNKIHVSIFNHKILIYTTKPLSSQIFIGHGHMDWRILVFKMKEMTILNPYIKKTSRL
jgi:hypothetical protein